ncbi:MAG: hypothetical protein AAFR76_09200 [Planctomycetota bacterium]
MAAGSALGQPAQIKASPDQFIVPDALPIEPQPDPVWRAPEIDDADQLRTHPPFDQIEPMRMPHQAEDIVLNVGPGMPLVHDGADGKIVAFPLYPTLTTETTTGPGHRSMIGQADEGGDIGPWAEGFGTMNTVSNVGGDPWRRNVKVVMRFVDQTGADRFFSCSGTMADPETVLLAGHCIYARTAEGPDIFDWAEEFWVYPGWDGNGTTFSNSAIIETHGFGYGTQAGAFTGWTQNGNFDWDLGVLRVNRAVGQLTGWYGWASDGGCGDVQSYTHYNPGYPGEDCDNGGPLHNGRDMYTWSGSIDSCPGNQLQINTAAGCFTAMWGGQSGSGVYHFRDGDRHVWGAASNSNRSTSGRYAQMWNNFRDFMIDFENETRGTALDLQAMRARYVESTVTAGQSLTGDSYVIANPTNNNPINRTYSVRHYLSDNTTISTFDTLLRSETFTWDFPAVGTVTVNIGGTSYPIPLNTPSGTYYAGVYLDYSDSTTGNNDSSLWDAHRVVVNGVADIRPTAVQASASTAITGGPVNMNITYQNFGGDPSNAVTADFRLSTNDFISTIDTELGTSSYSGLSGNGSSTRQRTVTIPAGTAPGTYYLGVIVTSSDDVNTGNNQMAISFPITVDSPADVVANSITTPVQAVVRGNTALTTISYSNTGTQSSGLVTADYRLSTNSTITTGDVPLGSAALSSLAGGDSSSYNRQVTIPAGTAPGSYYLGVIMTSVNDSSQSTAAIPSPIQVTIGRLCADQNEDGAVTPGDFNAWILNFNRGSLLADVNQDGNVAPGDFNAWILAFNSGSNGPLCTP